MGYRLPHYRYSQCDDSTAENKLSVSAHTRVYDICNFDIVGWGIKKEHLIEMSDAKTRCL